MLSRNCCRFRYYLLFHLYCYLPKSSYERIMTAPPCRLIICFHYLPTLVLGPSSSLSFGDPGDGSLNASCWICLVFLGSVCKVRTQDSENVDEEVKSLVTVIQIFSCSRYRFQAHVQESIRLLVFHCQHLLSYSFIPQIAF